ncbi:hypothetical protein EJ05DRAFT_389864 [Pseudovirgaria hyperparasitica]|uniref:Uncharacterized protein n=1 Tax=Pseudovirgaria hyperparasitica TaxID=470096 RepID=A0A6A6W3K8_9PEZI|nr:uncharacterized protein EJ05DRAFT_389864 [Pseudovirgaria hyperparasitica]KAF2757442.1 hypothetical protein EJ05DRAFT_389864 [Pseudovirgaria hyperparasitica]
MKSSITLVLAALLHSSSVIALSRCATTGSSGGLALAAQMREDEMFGRVNDSVMDAKITIPTVFHVIYDTDEPSSPNVSPFPSLFHQHFFVFRVLSTFVCTEPFCLFCPRSLSQLALHVTILNRKLII